MKGPGLRISLDVRRTWRCPRCGRTAKYSGDVVSQRCGCSSEVVWMQMSDVPKRPKVVQQAVVRPAAAEEAADACDRTPPDSELPVAVESVTVEQVTVESSAGIAVTEITSVTVQEVPVVPPSLPASPEAAAPVSEVSTPPSAPDAASAPPPPATAADEFGAGLVD